MERHAMQQLVAWKESTRRKPLILDGARQVGKTWLLKEFGRRNYHRVIYVSMDQPSPAQAIFNERRTPDDYLIGLVATDGGGPIDPERTLIIFDEIQEQPNALASLKHFNEQKPEYQIACAGSLLGIATHQSTSYPVGKVDSVALHPLSFLEFLESLGQGTIAQLIRDQNFSMMTALHDQLTEWLRWYFVVGGMPEPVAAYVDHRDTAEVRRIQAQILRDYDRDFSKHAPNPDVPRIRALWNSVPRQLAKENRRFVFSGIQEGARSRDYKSPLEWLKDAGLVHPVSVITAPRLPLRAYEDPAIFKLFTVDIGLMGAMAGLEPSVVVEENALFTEFKGSLTEQFVLQEMIAADLDPHYWTNGSSRAEVDFVLQYPSFVAPVEVKAKTNLRSQSLRTYRDKFHPPLSIRMSLAHYELQDGLVNLPLYAASLLPNLTPATKDEARQPRSS